MRARGTALHLQGLQSRLRGFYCHPIMMIFTAPFPNRFLLYVLQVPALVRFTGHPEVTASGELLYVFPSLQRTGRWQVGP